MISSWFGIGTMSNHKRAATTREFWLNKEIPHCIHFVQAIRYHIFQFAIYWGNGPRYSAVYIICKVIYIIALIEETRPVSPILKYRYLYIVFEILGAELLLWMSLSLTMWLVMSTCLLVFALGLWHHRVCLCKFKRLLSHSMMCCFPKFNLIFEALAIILVFVFQFCCMSFAINTSD